MFWKLQAACHVNTMRTLSRFYLLPHQFSTHCHINIIMYWQPLNKSPWSIIPEAPAGKVKNEQQRLQFDQPEHMTMVLHKAHSGFLQVITATPMINAYFKLLVLHCRNQPPTYQYSTCKNHNRISSFIINDNDLYYIVSARPTDWGQHCWASCTSILL